MEQRPRDPKAPLLDRASLRFIAATGVFKASVGGLLLLLLPVYGLTVAATRTVVFLYESIAQLLFAYPSRWVGSVPRPNIWLHLAVLFGIGLQALALVLPPLRQVLGLEQIGPTALVFLVVSVLVSWGAAEAFSRRAWSATHQRK